MLFDVCDLQDLSCHGDQALDMNLTWCRIRASVMVKLWSGPLECLLLTTITVFHAAHSFTSHQSHVRAQISSMDHFNLLSLQDCDLHCRIEQEVVNSH